MLAQVNLLTLMLPQILNYFLYIFSAMTTPQPQHITTRPVTGTIVSKVLPCFEGMDTSACPKEGCNDGFYCNGVKCVRKSECSCLVEGKVVKVSLERCYLL